MGKRVAAVLAVALLAGLGFGIWQRTHEGPPLQTVLRGINAHGDIIGYTSHHAKYRLGLVVDDGQGFLLHNGTFSSIDGPPGARQVYPAHLNPRGDVVGTYVDGDGHNHGFLFRQGTYTTIDYPGAADTSARGINAQGDIVGAYTDSGQHIHAFFWRRGVFTAIAAPGVSWANGINAQGDIVGTDDASFGPGHAFLWRRGALTTIDPPHEDTCVAAGINDRGEVVGTCFTDAQLFLWRQGTSTTIDDRQLGVTGGIGTMIAGDIGPQGDIVGTYGVPADWKAFQAANGDPSLLIYHGFRWHKGRFTTIDRH